MKLRNLTAEDAEALARMANNRNIWLNVRDRMPFPYSKADAEQFIHLANNANSSHIRAIEVDGSLVGAIGLHHSEDVYRSNLELGYWVGEEHWNKGYATQAVRLMCDLAFNELKANRVVASVFEYNEASAHILRKLGFKEEGRMRKHVLKDGKFVDEIHYGLLRTEW